LAADETFGYPHRAIDPQALPGVLDTSHLKRRRPAVASPTLAPEQSRPAESWASFGDINGFFGLMLDNIGVMILMAGLLVGGFGMPAEFVLSRMIPGTAVGVMVGDLIFTAMAFRLARRKGRWDVTAMPLGLDTPSTFGSVFLYIGPAYQAAVARGLPSPEAARHAWFLGIAMILASGVFKLACAPLCGLVRRAVPRAGLLGSLTAIALVLISFLPLLDIAAYPVAGFVALAVILATLTARWELPQHFPGALAGVLVGCLVYYVMHVLKLGPGLGAEGGRPSSAFRAALPMPVAEWMAWIAANWREAVGYLPVAIPLALATVVGGIDCTESAAAAGDEYPTGQIIAAEGVATVVGGLFGGVIQSTPYIGHPAYKAMGARAAYTLATALFVGGAGVIGYFNWIFYLIPQAVVFPILIFVGLEITSQSFHATARRHYPAVALACVPALAYLAMLTINRLQPELGKPFSTLTPQTQHWVETVTVLSGGFIVTSLLWGTTLAHLIDGRVRRASATLALAGAFAWFGVIHSPLPEGPIVAPSAAIARLKAEGRYEAAAHQTPYHWAAAYVGMAVTLLLLGRGGRLPAPEGPEHPGPP
jgi:adenine/guanine/hypoxanthine permease